MAIDFSFPEEVTFIVERVRRFCDEVVAPAQAGAQEVFARHRLLDSRLRGNDGTP